jgi:protein-S-isoprenylcysteine O-methyltransferase Ste14
MENATQDSARRKTISELLISHRKWGQYVSNGVFALYGSLWMFLLLVDFLTRHRVSSLLLVLFDAGVAWFAITRPMPKEINVSLYDWIIGFLSFLPLLLRPAPELHDHVLLLAVQLFGQSVALAGLFSLNKSFGIVAANRGVKTGGMYRVVRHPIYAGFFVFLAAYVLQNMTVMNAVIYVAYVAVQVMRMAAEERVLCRDPEYARYTRQTRWRVLPLVY